MTSLRLTRLKIQLRGGTDASWALYEEFEALRDEYSDVKPLGLWTELSMPQTPCSIWSWVSTVPGPIIRGKPYKPARIAAHKMRIEQWRRCGAPRPVVARLCSDHRSSSSHSEQPRELHARMDILNRLDVLILIEPSKTLRSKPSVRSSVMRRNLPFGQTLGSAK